MILTFQMLTETGLLWKINHDILHPLGLALAVESSFEGALLVADDGVWEFPDDINKQRSQVWDKFVTTVARPLVQTEIENNVPDMILANGTKAAPMVSDEEILRRLHNER